MKKSSRQVVGGAFAVLFATMSVSPIAAADYPITPKQRSTADQVASAGVPLADIAPDAPDSYTVVPGDTLWFISSKFLRQPWRWPELWGMNKADIRNPHLIYPGQILTLDKSNGRARLMLGSNGGGPGGTVKLSPRVRATDTLGPIPSIPAGAIEPFLTRPLIVSESELKLAPRVIGTADNRVVSGAGDKIYVRGDMPAEARNGYYVYRSGRALYDPDTKAVLGYEAQFLGSAEQTRQGDPATFRITTAVEEIAAGDRLVAAKAPEYVNYAPREAAAEIEGRVMSIYGGLDAAASNQII
ncbi:hypothetical protein BH09PSE6_BH09PSE6_15000 [soil metagenome]